MEAKRLDPSEARREVADSAELADGVEKHMLSAACTRCGAVIARHEPLVIVGQGGARHSTLALEPTPPHKGEAIYHPGCYESSAGEPVAANEQRLFSEALCAVDGSEPSLAGVDQAASLVGRGGNLSVLVVTAPRSGTGQLPGEDVDRMVHEACTLADRAGVSCRVEIDPARPVPEIVSDWAVSHGLLAIGASPKSVLAGLLFGGVTETATRSLSTPMLIARPVGAGGRFAERMLVASDGLSGSEELVAFASRVASQLDARLSLVHGQGRHPAGARARIDAQAGGIEREFGRETAVIEPGGAEQTIIDACTRLGASLVVMSSRRRTGLSAIGSVSRRVVRHGPCSTLLVPPEWLEVRRAAGGGEE